MAGVRDVELGNSLLAKSDDAAAKMKKYHQMSMDPEFDRDTQIRYAMLACQFSNLSYEYLRLGNDCKSYDD